jgi:hypothetical protein
LGALLPRVLGGDFQAPLLLYRVMGKGQDFFNGSQKLIPTSGTPNDGTKESQIGHGRADDRPTRRQILVKFEGAGGSADGILPKRH